MYMFVIVFVKWCVCVGFILYMVFWLFWIGIDLFVDIVEIFELLM